MEDLSSIRPEFGQNILLDGKECAHTIHGFEVMVAASAASSLGEVEAGSNKVKITTITNQNWGLPSHHGKIVASNNSYLSYVLEGRNGYVLRLLHRKTNSRALLKGFIGAIVDVAFFHSKSNLLACVDQGGNLYIWDLDLAKEEIKLQTDALMIVIRRSSTPETCEHRLIWSPHVSSQEEDEEEQDICNIVITHGNIAEVLDLSRIFSSYPNGTVVQRETLSDSIVSIMNAHEDDIVDLSLSPDASVLATASKDGHLKFWQVNLDEDEVPKCLHDFVPHGGACVSRLLFCDNHLCQDPGNQYWRFLITASENNTEVKIWCTVDWKCLQTVRFSPAGDGVDNVMPYFHLNLDLSASYLIAADSKRKVFLVLQLMSNVAQGEASFTSVTEYLLTQPIMSFVVCSCGSLPVGTDSEGDSGEEEEEEGVEESRATKQIVFDSRRNVALIELHCVHTRSMQELLLRFEPPDICGVPPSKKEPKMQTPEPVSIESEPASSSHHIESLSPVHRRPASFSSDIRRSSSPSTPTAFHSLNIAPSPKLLTPSEFTVAAKPLLDISAIPLLSPATIMASAKLSKDESLSLLQQEWPNFTAVSDDSLLVSDFQDTLSSLTISQSEASLAVEPSVNTLSNSICEDQLSVDEVISKHGGTDVVETTVELNEASVSSNHSKDPDETPSLQGYSSQKEAEPTGEVVQGNVLELIQVGPTHDITVSKQSFEQFTELLSHPEKLQEKRNALEEFMVVDSLEVLENVESGDKATASSFGNVLSESPPPLVLSPPKLVGETAAELSDWPIENSVAIVKEVAYDIEERCVSVSPISDAHSEKIGVSTEQCVNMSKSSELGFVMPSALSDHHIMLPWSGEEVEMPNVLLQPSDNAKDGSKAKKSRRKGKKAKKAITGGQVPMGGIEERNSDVEVIPGDSQLMLAAHQPSVVVNTISPAPDHQLLLSQLSQAMADQKEMLYKMEEAQQKSFTALQCEMQVLKESLVEEQKSVLAEFKRDQQQKMERLIKEKQTLDKQKQDRLISTISQTLTTAVNTKLDKLIKNEMRASAIPAIKESVSSVREELSKCVSRCMNETDVAIRDGVAHLVKSKDLSEAIGNAVMISLQESFPTILDNIFKNVLLAPIEKSIQEMFRQIDETFRRGTMDYLMQLQQQQQQLNSVQGPMLQQIIASVHALQSTFASPQNSPMAAHIQATIHQEVAAFSQRIQENVLDSVSRIVRKEVGAIVDMQSKANSQQLTMQDRKVQVCNMIQMQDYNAAFDLALSTSDLSLVIYTCQQVDPDIVFEMSPFPLSQPVLLSLIQQLSMNLHENLEMKIKYLDQSVLAMNVEDEVTKSHMMPVIKQLSQQLQLFQKKAISKPSCATPAVMKQIKRLLQVIQHVSH